MTLSSVLTQVATTYFNAKVETFTKHPLAQFVRSDAPKEILRQVGKSYVVKGSVGQSQWADVPWLAVLNPLETSSTQDGFYVVYLVNPILQRVYLSLNQGVTAVEAEFGSGQKQREMLEIRADLLRQRVKDLSDFDTSPIQLGGQSKLSQGYENAHAFGLSYELEDLRDNAKLERDLSLILSKYGELILAGGYTISPDEIDKAGKSQTVTEQKRRKLHERFERIGNNSQKVKAAKGYCCEACEFDFEKTYGELGHAFIEAHHLVPFSNLDVNASRTLDIEKDFAVLCANCHRMIHRMPDPSDLEGLRQILSARGKDA